MVNWDFLIDERLLGPLLPAEHVRLATPIAAGLGVFLSGLPAARQAEILAAQALLPPTASLAQRLGTLARCCAVLHKLGQVLARDQRLSLELRSHLRELESLPPGVPEEAIQQVLKEELGCLAERGMKLALPALAEASVAVVVPYVAGGTADQTARQGVLKILKPGIEERLGEELELLRRVGSHLDERCEQLQIPALDYEATFEQVRTKLLDEICLDAEQRHLSQARAFYDGQRQVHIPELYEGCTSRITAMERIFGEKITEPGRLRPSQRRRVGRLIVRTMLAQPLYTRAESALFHGDPHAGNLLLTSEGRLGILDWSLAGRLGIAERTSLVQVMLQAAQLRGGRVATLLEQLAEGRPVERPALRCVVEKWLRRLREGQIPGATWLTGLLDDAVQSARLRVAPDLILFRKSLHTLAGVSAEVAGSRSPIDEVLSCEFLRQFVRDWPRRWWAPPASRDYGTRISNLDLMWASWSGPSTLARFWVGRSCDWYQAWRDQDESGIGREAVPSTDR